MRKKLIIAPLARNDLGDVWDFVSPRGKSAANRFVAKIRKQCRQLARFPGIGRSREELAPGLRSFAVPPFVIFFQVHDRAVEIARVLHGARDLEAFWKTNTN